MVCHLLVCVIQRVTNMGINVEKYRFFAMFGIHRSNGNNSFTWFRWKSSENEKRNIITLSLPPDHSSVRLCGAKK